MRLINIVFLEMQKLIKFSKLLLDSKVPKLFKSPSMVLLSQHTNRFLENVTIFKHHLFSFINPLFRAKGNLLYLNSRFETQKTEENLHDLDSRESNGALASVFGDISSSEQSGSQSIKDQKHLKESSRNKIRPVAQKIQLLEKDIQEKFIKGSGKGGQAINKTNSCVELKHIPTGIVIQCQKTRSQAQNRLLARRLLLEKLDDHINGKLSKLAIKAAKVLKQKKKQRKRALAKLSKLKSKVEVKVDESSKKESVDP